jgi:hypothetical protein
MSIPGKESDFSLACCKVNPATLLVTWGLIIHLHLVPRSEHAIPRHGMVLKKYRDGFTITFTTFQVHSQGDPFLKAIGNKAAILKFYIP